MKKIVNGRKYDTDTAKEICSTRNYERGDSRWTELYRKKTGEFFFAHFTCWEGERAYVEPISEDEAKEFAERYIDADEYEAIFGEVSE